MARIIDYPKVQELVDSNIFLLDGSSGTKTILASKLGKALLDLMSTKDVVDNINIGELDGAVSFKSTDLMMVYTNDGNKKVALDDMFNLIDSFASSDLRRNIWRGKNLGSVVTEEQYEEIENGTFKGLFLGDFWYIGGYAWRIMDFDYWFYTGDRDDGCITHHVVIVPDTALQKRVKMNDTDITTGGYVGSKMNQTNLRPSKTIINGTFNSPGHARVLQHRNWLVNAVSNGHPSGGAWYISEVELLNENMVYGSSIAGASFASTESVYPKIEVEKTQLAGFRLNPSLISKHRDAIWLRDVVSNKHFSAIYSAGAAAYAGAADTLDVRPVFGLCKQNL